MTRISRSRTTRTISSTPSRRNSFVVASGYRAVGDRLRRGAELVAKLQDEFGIHSGQIYARKAPLGLGDLIELTTTDAPKLKNASWRPVTRRALVQRDPARMLARIRPATSSSTILTTRSTRARKLVSAVRDPKSSR